MSSVSPVFSPSLDLLDSVYYLHLPCWFPSTQSSPIFGHFVFCFPPWSLLVQHVLLLGKDKPWQNWKKKKYLKINVKQCNRRVEDLEAGELSDSFWTLSTQMTGSYPHLWHYLHITPCTRINNKYLWSTRYLFWVYSLLSTLHGLSHIFLIITLAVKH